MPARLARIAARKRGEASIGKDVPARSVTSILHAAPTAHAGPPVETGEPGKRFPSSASAPATPSQNESGNGETPPAPAATPLESSAAPRRDAVRLHAVGLSAEPPQRKDEPGSAGEPGEAERIAELEQRLLELQTQLDHRERQIDALRRTSEALFSKTSVDDLVRETLTLATDVLRADSGSLLLHDPANDTLVFRYVIGPAAPTLTGFVMPSSQGIAGRVFGSAEPDLTHKVSEQKDFNRSVDEKTGYHTESMMTVPVRRSESDPIGVMQILNNAEHLFDEHDLEVLQVLSAVAASAIDHARLSNEARKAAIVNVIGDISHDIKNMLTPIQTGVWTLESLLDEMFHMLEAINEEAGTEGPLAEKLTDAMSLVREDYGWILQNALDAAEKVQSRTKEIADAVKGESAAPFFEEADVNDTAQEVARALRLVAHDKQIDLQLDLDLEPAIAEFDRKQLYNALYNLVNNAIPETPEGGSVTIRTRRARKDEDSLSIEVQDTGRGIPEHVRSKLFTADAVSTKPGGTGLGTRIVADVVRRHGGTITVASEVGRGSVFAIRLPLRHDDC